MKGLIIKDLLNMKRYLRNVLVMLIVYCAIFIPQNNFDVISGVIMIMFSMLVVTTISYDDAAKWDKYALAMPLSRRDIVLSKYMLALIFLITGAVICIIALLASGLFIETKPLSESMSVLAIIIALGLFFEALVLPLIYKYGVERARLMMILCLLIPTGLVVLGAKVFGDSIPAHIEQMLPLIALAATAVLFYISYIIALKIFQRKEF